MNPLTILQMAITWGPTVKAILDEATSNDGILAKIESLSKPLASLLASVGSALFPKAAPELHTVAGAIAAFDPNMTKWLQGSLNSILNLNPPLVVDGLYGPKTVAAVEQVQTKLGLKVDGLAGQITQAAIAAVMTKAPTLVQAK